MRKSSLRTDEEISLIYERNIDAVFRLCLVYLKNRQDAEDAAQDTFCRLIDSDAAFENAEHERRWLCKVAANICKNMLRHWFRHHDDWEAHQAEAAADQTADQCERSDVLKAVMSLSEKHRTAVYLYYFEGYPTKEIAALLSCPESTVRNRLRDARLILKNELGEDFYEK